VFYLGGRCRGRLSAWSWSLPSSLCKLRQSWPRPHDSSVAASLCPSSCSCPHTTHRFLTVGFGNCRLLVPHPTILNLELLAVSLPSRCTMCLLPVSPLVYHLVFSHQPLCSDLPHFYVRLTTSDFPPMTPRSLDHSSSLLSFFCAFLPLQLHPARRS
jgi:hypothetical protein